MWLAHDENSKHQAGIFLTADKSNFIINPFVLGFKYITKQEAMENFVFPDEIKTKLMKMTKLYIFYAS